LRDEETKEWAGNAGGTPEGGESCLFGACTDTLLGGLQEMRKRWA